MYFKPKSSVRFYGKLLLAIDVYTKQNNEIKDLYIDDYMIVRRMFLDMTDLKDYDYYCSRDEIASLEILLNLEKN